MTKTIPYTYQDKHGTYYVRFVFPKRCRQNVPNLNRDIRRTLKTKYIKQAIARSQWYISQWELIVEKLIMSPYRTKSYYRNLIESLDYFRFERECLAKNAYEGNEEHQILELIRMIDPYGNNVEINYGDPDEDLRAATGLQELWVNIDAAIKKKNVELQAEFANSPEKLASLHASYLRANPENQKGKHSVTEVVDVYIQDKGAGVGEQTLNELRTGLDLFIHFIGDTPFNEITEKSVREFKKLVPNTPARISQRENFKSWPLVEIVKFTSEHGLPLLAKKTVEKKIESVKGLLEWAMHSSEFIDRDLSKVLSRKFVNTSGNAGVIEYKSFETEHLVNLSNSYLYKEALPKRLQKVQPHKFWVSLIALFTGCRLEEVCQLYLQDFSEVNDIPIIKITDDDEGDVGKEVKIKTKSSYRWVPIHSQLISFGILDYVAELQSKNETRLFPELDNKNAKNKYSFLVTKWFGDTLRKQIKYEKNSRYCFHSFRKSFIQRLQNHTDVPREVRKALVGHSVGGGDVHERYEGHYDIPILNKAINKLKYPEMDFEGVTWNDFQARVTEWEKLKGEFS